MTLTALGLILLVAGLLLWLLVTPAGMWLALIGLAAVIAGLYYGRRTPPP